MTEEEKLEDYEFLTDMMEAYGLTPEDKIAELFAAIESDED